MKHQNSKGYTLVELMVVIAILGISIGLMFPAVQPDREKARRLQCANNLKQLTMAAHNYHQAMLKLPSSCRKVGTGNEVTASELLPNGYSWLVELLPFLGAGELSKQFDKLGSPNDADSKPEVREGMSRRSKFFICPSSIHKPAGWVGSNNKQGLTNYVAMSATHAESLRLSVVKDSLGCNYDPTAKRPDGATYPGSKTTLESIKDGNSYTIYTAETADEFRRWAVGADASVVALPTSGSGAKQTVSFINKGEGDGFKYAALKGWEPGKFNEETTVKEENRLCYANWDYEDEDLSQSDGYIDVVSQNASGAIVKAPVEAKGQIRKGVSSYHQGVILHGLCDASVLNISSNIDPQIYMFMTTACGADPSAKPE